jgi:hypothetical protein
VLLALAVATPWPRRRSRRTFVVVEEVIPESQSGGHSDLATLGAMVGFAVMMTLDVALG